MSIQPRAASTLGQMDPKRSQPFVHNERRQSTKRGVHPHFLIAPRHLPSVAISPLRVSCRIFPGSASCSGMISLPAWRPNTRARREPDWGAARGTERRDDAVASEWSVEPGTPAYGYGPVGKSEIIMWRSIRTALASIEAAFRTERRHELACSARGQRRGCCRGVKAQGLLLLFATSRR